MRDAEVMAVSALEASVLAFMGNSAARGGGMSIALPLAMRVAIAHFLLACAALVTASMGCSSKKECNCPASGANILVEPAGAHALVSVTATGPACNGDTPTCLSPIDAGVADAGTETCREFLISASYLGTCHIEATTVGGTTTTFDVNVQQVSDSDCGCQLYSADKSTLAAP